MPDPDEVVAGAAVPAEAGGEVEHEINPVAIELIEFENTLFNDGSAVLMPDRIGDADADDDNTLPTSFKLLGLAYKQFELDDRKKMLVAGHSTAGATDAENESLSEFRAKSILYLLTGDRVNWSAVCVNHHQIIDYKRVMAFFSRIKGWRCTPAEISNEWNAGDDDDDGDVVAVRQFFRRYNRWAPRANRVPGNIHERISSEENHLWSGDAWRAVFHLYLDMLRRALNVQLTALETLRALHQYANPDQFVACSNRIPIHADYEDDYRVGDNHNRVEILFLFQDIEVLDCSEGDGERFPMCERAGYEITMCNMDDLTAWPYHLKFIYYNRVKNSVEDIPNMLDIKTFSRNHEEVNNVRKSFQDGVYTLKIPQAQLRRRIYFAFETAPPDPYPPAETVFLFTDTPDSNPASQSFTPEQVSALTALNRQKYYDLPIKWSSRNYWTRYQDGDNMNGNRFHRVVNNTKRLKPYGSNKTKASEPLTFSLDDIVLAKTTRNQRIKDLRTNGTTERNLHANSRYTLFHIEHRTIAAMPEVDYESKKLKALRIHNPKFEEPSFTDQEFNKNLIHDVPDDTRVINFAGQFYDAYDKRTHDSNPGFSFRRDHVLGARMALCEDTGVHIKKIVDGENDATAVAQNYSLKRPGDASLSACGNYEMHYIHNCATFNDKMLAYLIIFWSTRFTRINNAGGIVRGTVANVTDHREAGMDNAMKRLNKNYHIEKHLPPPAPPPPDAEADAEPTADPMDIIIRPFHFMETKKSGRGGKVKAVTNIIRDTKSGGESSGAWMSPEAAQLRARDYENDPSYFGATDPGNAIQDTDGSTYNVLTNHHEFGHATGNWDDYLYDFVDSSNNNWDDLPRYNQPYTAEGGPYLCDKIARMRVNRTPRLRNFWKFVCWLHDDSADNTKPLHGFFHNVQFKLTFEATGALTHNFFLEEVNRNVAEAARNEINYTIDPDVECDLFMYKLGDDELAHLIDAAQVFDSILVVRTKFAIKFDNAPTAWTFANARAWAQNLNNALKTMLNEKFRIACSTVDNGFKNIYLIFIPHFNIYETNTTGSTPAFSYANAVPADCHFDLRMKFRDGHNVANAAKVVNVDWGDVADSGDDLRSRLIRYCYGKTGTGDLAKADLSKFVEWVQTHYGDGTNAYAIHDL